MPNTLVLLARMIIQVSASKVSATMTAKTHQQQVSQVLPVIDFKLMPFTISAKTNFSTGIYILVDIWLSLYEENRLLALIVFTGVKVLGGRLPPVREKPNIRKACRTCFGQLPTVRCPQKQGSLLRTAKGKIGHLLSFAKCQRTAGSYWKADIQV